MSREVIIRPNNKIGQHDTLLGAGTLIVAKGGLYGSPEAVSYLPVLRDIVSMGEDERTTSHNKKVHTVDDLTFDGNT